MLREGIAEQLDSLEERDTKEMIADNRIRVFRSESESLSAIHVAHKLIIFTLVIGSAASIRRCENTPPSWSVAWSEVLNWIAGRPGLDSMVYLHGMLCCLFVMACFSLFVSYCCSGKNVVSRIHVFMNMIVLPIPSIAIGAHFGFFFLKLVHSTTYAVELLMAGACFVLYLWNSWNFNRSYNSGGVGRRNSLQTKQEYAFVKTVIDILPCIFSAMPWILEALITPSRIHSTVHIIVVAVSGIVLCVVCVSFHPFLSMASNRHVIWLAITSTLFSAAWYFCEKHKSYAGIHFAVCLITGIILLFIFESTEDEQEGPAAMEVDVIHDALVLHMEDVSHEEPEQVVSKPWPLSLFSFHLQDLVLGIFTFSGVAFMLWMNVITAKQMPAMQALPDVGHATFRVADVIRTSEQYGTFQFSNLAVFACISLLVVGYLIYPNKLNMRRPVFCYGVLAFIRGLAFSMTKMPAPCAGSENCPCADPKILKMIKETDSFSIWLSWLFGLGMHITFPQCGDLVISGHTMFLWLAMRMLHDFLPKFMWGPVASLVNFAVTGLVAAAMLYIIIAKNHYSIDVYFGALFTEFVWSLYRVSQQAASKIDSNNHYWLVKLVQWIESRPVPLDEANKD